VGDAAGVTIFGKVRQQSQLPKIHSHTENIAIKFSYACHKTLKEYIVVTFGREIIGYKISGGSISASCPVSLQRVIELSKDLNNPE
jgi:hypothetical protein